MKCEDAEYFEYLKNRNPIKMTIRKILLKNISKNFNGTVLDVGCGIGEFLETHPNSVGCDINKNSIKYCHDKNLMVFYCNIEKNTPKETYDGIFCSNVIEHLKNYTNGLNNINESLKEGGILIILLPNKRGYKRDKTHNPKFNYNELIIWLKNKNYKIKKSNLLKLPIPLCFNDIVLICKK